ncbi:hypothetical protein [Neptunomonas sp.]|uniref:hypothetical protein n=1 Tax=Neptunomonas sp. TaxID=1971898 RepID=UPI0035635CAD
MLAKIERWIDQTLSNYSDKALSCSVFSSAFKGFYSPQILENCFFVVLDDIPKPDFPELHEAGLGDFINMDVQGITYKNTYFIKKGYENDLEFHFHELVHVQQWHYLGAQNFVSRYIQEINQHGYQEAPLEQMAYGLGAYFSAKNPAIDIPAYVQSKI